MARMLDMVPKRGPEAYEKFMEVLTPDYPWIVENFRDREEDMKSKGKTINTKISDSFQPPKMVV